MIEDKLEAITALLVYVDNMFAVGQNRMEPFKIPGGEVGTLFGGLQKGYSNDTPIDVRGGIDKEF